MSVHSSAPDLGSGAFFEMSEGDQRARIIAMAKAGFAIALVAHLCRRRIVEVVKLVEEADES